MTRSKSYKKSAKAAPLPHSLIVPPPEFRITLASRYYDPLKINPFTRSKMVFASISIGLGFFSAVYTLPIGKQLLPSLNFMPSIVDNVIGGMAVFGNTAANTPQLYASSLHIYQDFFHPRNLENHSRIKTIASIACAVSGASVVGFIAGTQLEEQYPNYIGLAFATALASGAEFYLGGDPFWHVIKVQIPATFSSRNRYDAAIENTEVETLDDDEENQLLNEQDRNARYGTSTPSTPPSSMSVSPPRLLATTYLTLQNQAIADVFAKMNTVLGKLTTDEKTAVKNFVDKLYFHADTTFVENPGLFFYVLLLGKMPADHPLFSKMTPLQTATIINLLKNSDIKTIREKLKNKINKVALSPEFLNLAFLRFNISFSIPLICTSYLVDTGKSLSAIINASGLDWSISNGLGWTTSLVFGIWGLLMMFTLGVSLNHNLATTYANMEPGEIKNLPWEKVTIGIVFGLMGAFLEATLCSFMTNNTTGLNWALAIVGFVIKGVIINAPYAYMSADAASFIIKHLISCCCTPNPQKTADQTVAAITEYADMLAKNARELPFVDLDEWSKTGRALASEEKVDTEITYAAADLTVPKMRTAGTQKHVSWFHRSLGASGTAERMLTENGPETPTELLNRSFNA